MPGESRKSWRRRIFVQTDNGSVLDMEVHRNDKVQSIKKKVQAALRIPTEQTELSFGDHVLQDDVSELRCDSPVLLTRTELHRSSSSPCLEVNNACINTVEELRTRFEIVGGWSSCLRIKHLIQECCQGIEHGVDPIPAQGGLGGAYYFRNAEGRKIAIVKPADEEPLAPNNPRGFVGCRLGQAGLSRWICVGETGVREVAAYLLDHAHFARVPATVLVKAVHPIFHVNSRVRTGAAKIDSFQEFVEHDYQASECGSSRFPASAVHRIGILDIRLFNTDRHAGNILVRHHHGQGGYLVELIPIDHGLCLPESIEDPYFEWLHWPQASFPFSEEEVDYVRGLDPTKDADMLRKQLPMLKEACIRTMVVSTTFLQLAVEEGLCLVDIGSMMTKELDACSSPMEKLCAVAKDLAEQEQTPTKNITSSDSNDEEQHIFEMEMDDNPYARLPHESSVAKQLFNPVTEDEVQSKRSTTLQCHPMAKQLFRSVSALEEAGDCCCGCAGKMPKVAARGQAKGLLGMCNKEWSKFLKCFRSVCSEAFQKYKADLASSSTMRRLGTSCQF